MKQSKANPRKHCSGRLRDLPAANATAALMEMCGQEASAAAAAARLPSAAHPEGIVAEQQLAASMKLDYALG